MAADEHDQRYPIDAVVLPFIFIPDGEPIPPEWLSRHRDVIQMRAMFVPHPPESAESEPHWPVEPGALEDAASS